LQANIPATQDMWVESEVKVSRNGPETPFQ